MVSEENVLTVAAVLNKGLRLPPMTILTMLGIPTTKPWLALNSITSGLSLLALYLLEIAAVDGRAG